MQGDVFMESFVMLLLNTAEFSLRILVARERCNVTEEYSEDSL